MVDKKEAILKININYEKEQKDIELTDLPSLKKLKKLAAEKFNISKNHIDTIYFEYYDEDGDLNLLEEENNLFEISNETSNDNIYNLKLNLNLGESCTSSRIFESRIFKSQRINISKSINKENEDNNDKKYEDLKKENLELRKKIEEMKKIIELEKEINEIKMKRERKKWDKEKKMMELKINNLEKIKKLKNTKDNFILNKYINDLEKDLVDNIVPLLEKKIKSEMEAKNKIIEDVINAEMNNILAELNNKLENKKNEMINYNKTEISNILLENKKYFKNINDSIDSIKNKINIIKKDNNPTDTRNNDKTDDINNPNLNQGKNNNKILNIKTNNNTGQARAQITNVHNNRNKDDKEYVSSDKDNQIINEKKIKNKLNNLLIKTLFYDLNDINISQEEKEEFLDLYLKFNDLRIPFIEELNEQKKTIFIRYQLNEHKKIKYQKKLEMLINNISELNNN